MMPDEAPDFREILQHFDLSGHVDSVAAHGGGHINDTWLIRFVHHDARKRYVLQRINRHVFPDPLAVMDNVDRVCRHVQVLAGAGHARALPGQRAFTLIRTRQGTPCWQDPDGEVWRLWPFVYGARTADAVASPAQAREAARAFGHFQSLLRDLPGPPLHEVIPGFHDTLARFAQFQRALDDDDSGRAAHCGPEIEFAYACEAFIRQFAELAASGALPVRIAHNDAKINNVMLDDEHGKAVCVIDLDTVMPGLALFDFGDMVRTMTTTAAEDETESDTVDMDMTLYKALADGYLGAVPDFLSSAEIEAMPDAGRIITLETGLRFLTDYLHGDRYFRTARPDHNLDRCRTQFALARSIERQTDEMRAVTDAAARRLAAAG